MCYTRRIHHTQTTLFIRVARLRLYPAAVAPMILLGSIFSPVYAEDVRPLERAFLVTGYYSPLPNQCCYARGSYEADLMFNGGGVKTADGTPVYPGTIAAPASYAYGTRITLEGMGVGTVHDRGARINAMDGDTDHVDVWMGYGEEGLARAMNWGAKNISGTVHAGSADRPKEDFSLEEIPSPLAALASYAVADKADLLIGLKLSDRKFGVRGLQKLLSDVGYFSHPITDLYGETTRQAVHAFQRDYGVSGDGSAIDERTRASLLAASSITEEHVPDLSGNLGSGSRGDSVRQAQKLLRFLGYYRGRTDGVFDADLRAAVRRFQLSNKIVQSSDHPSAGRIGPKTKAAIIAAWKVEVTRHKADLLQRKMHIAEAVRKQLSPGLMLSKGDRGTAVTLVQQTLRRMGYLDGHDVSGYFGDRTRRAVTRYQLDRKLLTTERDPGAGNFGPATKSMLMKDLVNLAWKDVRANGADE